MENWTEDIVDKLLNAKKIPLESLDDTDSNIDCFYDGIVARCYRTVFKDRDLEMCTDENCLGTHYFFLTNQKGGTEAYCCFCYLNDELVFFSPEDNDMPLYYLILRFLIEATDRYNADKIERIDCKAYTSDYLEALKGNANDRQYININNDERYEDIITSNPGTPEERTLYICYPVPRELGLSLEDKQWEEIA